MRIEGPYPLNQLSPDGHLAHPVGIVVVKNYEIDGELRLRVDLLFAACGRFLHEGFLRADLNALESEAWEQLSHNPFEVLPAKRLMHTLLTESQLNYARGFQVDLSCDVYRKFDEMHVEAQRKAHERLLQSDGKKRHAE